VGIEAQIIVVLYSLDYILRCTNRFRFSKRDWTLVMSAFIIGVVLPMKLKMKFGRDKMEAKKLNRYDKAYLGIATEWGVCPYCKRKQVGQ
jgi:hypothetical protein